jgi:hypothetical protein
MSEKQTKKLRWMAKEIYSHQLPNTPHLTLEQIFQRLKFIHKIKTNNGNKNQNKTAKKVIT